MASQQLCCSPLPLNYHFPSCGLFLASQSLLLSNKRTLPHLSPSNAACSHASALSLPALALICSLSASPMAVQAQYPSDILLPDFCKRARPPPASENRSYMAYGNGNAVVGSAEDFLFQPMAADLLRIYNSVTGLNVSPQPVLNTGTMNETANDLPCNLATSRKRQREDDDVHARQQASFISFAEFQQNNPTSSFIVPNTTVPRFNGLRLAFDDSRPSPAASSVSGRGSSVSSLSCVLNEELQSQLVKQREEIDQLVKIQGERLKQALDEKRQRHARSLLAAVQENVLRSLKEKELEVEKISRRNAELEERVKQLSMESQIWQNMAKNNEAMVSSLRSNLEQVVAQSREQSKGVAEREEDAESCNYEDSGDAHARTMKENSHLKEQRNCRVCKNNSVCVLLLPCRHLCLCKECDPHRSDCPICGAHKSASVQVYVD